MRRARLPAVAAISFAASVAALLTPAAATAAVSSANPDPVLLGGTATFRIVCGSSATSAKLSGADLGLAHDYPMGATGAGRFSLTLDIPRNVAPGRHDVHLTCSNGDSGTVRVRIASDRETVDSPSSGAAMTAAVLGGGGAALAAVCGAIVLGRRQELDSSD